MVNGDSLLDGEELIRRFDPNRPGHCTYDDAGLPAKLRSGAFRWDPVPESEPVRRELSVYQATKLVRRSLSRWDCIDGEAPDSLIAAISVGDVRGFQRPSVDDANPFDAVEDEFPDGEPPKHAQDAAHALIVHAEPLRGSDKWYRELARRFSVVPREESRA